MNPKTGQRPKNDLDALVLATPSGADVDRTLMRMLLKPINLVGLVPGRVHLSACRLLMTG